MRRKTMILLTALMLTVTAIPCGAQPTETPVPTGAPAVTDTPEVTETPTPTETPEVTETPTPTDIPAPQLKNGLLKEGSYYRYYTDGKLLKNSWKNIGKKRYYFKANGNAATGSYKIKSVYYVFNAKGQLLKSTKARIVKVGKSQYYVDKNGKAIKGIDVIGDKLYSFKTNGLYDQAKTKKLRAAAKYEKNFSGLKKLIGKPKKAKYYSSCYGPGRDGVLTYARFVVYTYRYNGKEIVLQVAKK